MGKRIESNAPRGKPFQKGHTLGFKKGKSGNPGGRPRDLPEFRADLRKRGQAAVESLLAAAADGDVRACEIVLAYAWGRPTQGIDMTVDDASKLPPEERQRRFEALMARVKDKP